VLRIGISVGTFVEMLVLNTASAAIDGKVVTLATASTAVGQFQLYVEEIQMDRNRFKLLIFAKGGLMNAKMPV